MGIRVLLAEDNVINQKVACYMLKSGGYDVTIAANGIRAVDACRTGTFDVVLMDINMPEMNGIDATLAIREHDTHTGRHTPIIAITARALDEDRSDCEDAGMDGYVSKPFKRHELHAEIERVLKVAPPDDERVEGAPGLGAAQTLGGDGAIRGDGYSEGYTIHAEFDPTRLNHMLDGDREKIDEFVRQFVADFPEQISALEQALVRVDIGELERRAHNLKGTAANLGFTRISRAAGELEELIHAGRIDDAHEQIAELRAERDLMGT